MISTTWTPADSVFQANTDYTVSLALKTGVGYTFTKDTVFTLNSKTIVPVADGENYIIHYAEFPTTEDNGSNSESGNGSNNESGNGSNNESGNDVGSGSNGKPESTP